MGLKQGCRQEATVFRQETMKSKPFRRIYMHVTEDRYKSKITKHKWQSKSMKKDKKFNKYNLCIPSKIEILATQNSFKKLP